MLVLTRKVGEEIIIDGSIRITITQIKGDRVRIGVTAPPSVRVDRAEVAERKAEFIDFTGVAAPAGRDSSPRLLPR